jgi:LacI family repressor for deo operon, udp, cdd, tsx, nupC, and nupG
MVRGQEAGPRSAVTIADVAKAVGVATSTVSRALSQPGRVSDDMRRRVLEAAQELGYRPNPHARSLLSGRTQNVGLLVPDATNPFYFGLIRGSQTQARSRGYRQFLVDTEASANVEAAMLHDLISSVDGLILTAPKMTDAALREAAAEVPLVLVNRDVPGLPSVVLEQPEGVVQALEHLASFGHRSVAYLAGPPGSWSSRRRWRTIQQAGRRLGITARQLGPYSPTSAAGAAAADAALNIDVTACLFFNDRQAIGALQRFAERGVTVPDDMSVVGSGDIFGADFCHPPLTTVYAPVEYAGRVAIDILLDSLLPDVGPNVAPRRELLPTHLTIRASTGPAPKEG